MNEWIFCDERLPDTDEAVFILVVEIDHGGKTTDKFWNVETDIGWYHAEDTDFHRGWTTSNDWDEGQPWAVVAWMPRPDESDIRKHRIDWINGEAEP